MAKSGALLLPPVRITGDNKAVIEQCDGTWVDDANRGILQTIIEETHSLGTVLAVHPRHNEMQYFHRVKRVHNKAADHLANNAMDNKQDTYEWSDAGLAQLLSYILHQTDCFVHVRFDGGYRPEEQQARVAIRIQICQTRGKTAISQDILKMGIQIPPVDSYYSELRAAQTALNFTKRIYARMLAMAID